MIYAMDKENGRYWFPLDVNGTLFSSLDFDRFYFKIDNKVYLHYDQEVEKAFMWERLKE